jgi:hypothetical protein
MCSSADLMRQDVHHRHQIIRQGAPSTLTSRSLRRWQRQPSVARKLDHRTLRPTEQALALTATMTSGPPHKAILELQEMKATRAARCVRIETNILVPLGLSRYRTPWRRVHQPDCVLSYIAVCSFTVFCDPSKLRVRTCNNTPLRRGHVGR